MDKENKLIVKANNLIEGFMEMTKQEYIFILNLISKIRKDDKDFLIQKTTVQEFATLLDISKKHVYEQLEGFEDKLASRYISVKYENGSRLKVPWFGYLKYHNGIGTLETKFNSDLKDSLLQLDTNFTKYYLKNVKSLTSQYSIRLYELLKQYETIGEREIELEELKLMLGIKPNQYNLYADFKRKVLISPTEKINNSKDTDINISFIEIKTGRKVTSIKFIINGKPQVKPDEDLLITFKKATGYNFPEKTLIRLINSVGYKRIKLIFDNIDRFSYPKDPVGFFITAIEGNPEKGIKPYDIPTCKKPVRKQVVKAPQQANFEQRKYEDGYLDSLYDNF